MFVCLIQDPLVHAQAKMYFDQACEYVFSVFMAVVECHVVIGSAVGFVSVAVVVIAIVVVCFVVVVVVVVLISVIVLFLSLCIQNQRS